MKLSIPTRDALIRSEVRLVHRVGLIMQILPSSSLARVRAVILMIKERLSDSGRRGKTKSGSVRFGGRWKKYCLRVCAFPYFCRLVFCRRKNKALYLPAVSTSRFHSDTLLQSCSIWAVSVATPKPWQSLIWSHRPQQGWFCSPPVCVISSCYALERNKYLQREKKSIKGDISTELSDRKF